MIPRYRKKSIIIHAEQYDGTPESISKIQRLGGNRKVIVHPDHLEIVTLEGNHRADINDFIIKGIAGEIYPCKPDIFQKTYEKI